MSDPVAALPPELVEKILSPLTLPDLLNCSLVSKLWHNTTNNNNILWKNLCISRGWKSCHEFDDCINNFLSFDAKDRQQMEGFAEWKKYFILKNRVKDNWMNGKYRKVETAVPPDVCEGSCYTMSTSTVAVGTFNGLVKLFDIRNDDFRLIQTIQFKNPYSFSDIRLSSEHLVFCDEFHLFVYKLNESGTYTFCTMKVIGEKEVLTITDASNLVGDRDADSSDNLGGPCRAHDIKGLEFCLNDDFLVAVNLLSRGILVWDLQESPLLEIEHVFERGEGTAINSFCLMDDQLSASFIINTKTNDHVTDIEEYHWFFEAYSLKHNSRMYRSETLYEGTSPMAAYIETNNSYTVNGIFYHESSTIHIYFFDRTTGRLIYQRFADFVDITAYPENTDFVAILKNEFMIMYNPKTDCTLYTIELQGMFTNIYNYVLVTLCEEHDNVGKTRSKLEFWRLKNAQPTDDYIHMTVLPQYHNCHVACNDSGILFRGPGSLFLIHFVV
ncbi:uncharacterized protein LOC111046688 isoform X2 [Nilaparvata lugens]|uniref:uncharacterized protein LOC111046688 isoform X2 n=1 Tax=Nilaparvata lugens TaxID=108931 RepID=UPI00193C9103|nr:uncharacterized protein LOC111046688 isoform X2 [Nilaparvata lugens]